MLWMAEKNGWQRVQVVQPMYNLLARGIEQEFLPMCREFGLAVIAYNPLAGGLLTGKHARCRARRPARGSIGCRSIETATGTRRISPPWRSCRNWPARPAARCRPWPGWLAYHRGIEGLILGASRLEQLQENLAALDAGPLPDETLAGCERVWESLARRPTPV